MAIGKTVTKHVSAVDERERPFSIDGGLTSAVSQVTWSVSSTFAATSQVAEITASTDLAGLRSAFATMIQEDIAKGRRKETS